MATKHDQDAEGGRGVSHLCCYRIASLYQPRSQELRISSGKCLYLLAALQKFTNDDRRLPYERVSSR